MSDFEVLGQPAEGVDFLAVFAALAGRERVFYRRDRTGEEFLFAGVALAADTGNSLSEDFGALREALGRRVSEEDRAELLFAGWTAFDSADSDEPGDPDDPGDGNRENAWQAFGRRELFLPRLTLRRRQGESRALIVAPTGQAQDVWARYREVLSAKPGLYEQELPGIEQVRWLDEAAFREGVAQVTSCPELEKVVLARRAEVIARAPWRPAAVVDRLRARFSNCTVFALSPAPKRGGPVFLGASPERLARVEARELETMALAGTTRGATSREEAEAALLASAKDRAEHHFVVAMLEEALLPLTESPDRKGAVEPELLRLANVSHLHTPIRRKLREGVGLSEVVDALHPTPAVCGVPQGPARARIQELEGFDRGLYAGALGWMDLEGNGAFDVALRCALLCEERALLFMGAGITAESEVEVECAETRRKADAMLRALGAMP